MYKTTVIIWSEKRISPSIGIRSLAHWADNGDEVGVASIKCVEIEDYENDLDYGDGMPWLAEDEYRNE